MGFEISEGGVFYLIIMVIVIAIGIGIVTGFDSTKLVSGFGQALDGGKVSITEPEKYASMDCRGAAYLLKLEDPKFDYVPRQGDKSLNFFVVLDYNRLLFVGKAENGAVQNITCTDKPECSEVDLNFLLQGIGGITGKQVFHFTTWAVSPTLQQAAERPDQTLNSMLEDYSYAYVSSFNVVIENTQRACDVTDCRTQADEASCISSTTGCYWKGECNICPTSQICGDYTGDQCTRCTIAVANCKPGILWGCEAR